MPLWGYRQVSTTPGIRDEAFVEDGGEALVQRVPDTPWRGRLKVGGGKVALTGVVLLLCLGVFERQQIAAFADAVLAAGRRLGPLAPFVVGGATAVLNLLIFPTFPLMAGAGALFGDMYGVRWGAAIGTATVFLGLWSSSVGAFCLGRYCFQDYARRELERRAVLRVVNGMIEKEGLKIVFLASMSPILPAGLLNYVCSLVERLTVQQYAVGCLGLLLPVTFWVSTSAQAAVLAREGGTPGRSGALLLLVNVLIIGGLTAVLHRAYRRHRTEVDDEQLLETELASKGSA